MTFYDLLRPVQFQFRDHLKVYLIKYLTLSLSLGVDECLTMLLSYVVSLQEKLVKKLGEEQNSSAQVSKN